MQFYLGGQLLSPTKENTSRNKKTSILGNDNIGDGEHTTIFKLSICCSGQILQQSKINNFVPFTFSPDLEFLAKLDIS